MDEYIKRTDALKVIETANSMVSSLLEATMKLCVTMDRIAAADVVPVVRHGRWSEVEHGESGVLCECSACKEWMLFYYGFVANFCPNCGAKMDKDGDIE